MGGHECWVQPNGFFPNGLLPDEAASVTRVLDPERWSLAEERTADLISHIQPNQPSEERREAVACYVQRLIAKCFSCRVVTFGSVPLKTYLPDGDIDLTTFSDTQNLKDSWANAVRDVLESEEKSEDAEFRVKEVQYIQAEVKIIKCLVENIVVDISFNQLGGLCTLCFLEQVDRLINQNHLFKRSIILIKAWCYYESRILGAHHGLISTYALETLVLYIFHVFNNSFAGPLEVLYRFLEFFSKFDWDNFCVSLWGPVAIKSLPDMRVDPPRKDSGELLLSKLFLNACSSVYALFPGGQENQEQPFISKHFNVIDPLRTNNNLGRSVSKGNFFRIRSAFAFGAQRLARLLECPKGNIIAEVNQFFTNTWDRHGKGHRADASSPDLHGLRPVNFNQIDGSDSLKNHSGCKKVKEDGVSSQHGNYSSKRVSRSGNVSVVSRGQCQKTYANLTSSMPSDQNHQIPQCISSNGNTVADKGRNSTPDYFQNEVHGSYQVARTHSSPELTETSSEIPSQGRHNRASETGKGQTTAKLENNRRRNLGSEVAEKHSGRFSFEESPSSRQSSSQRSIDAAFDLNNASNSCNVEFGSGGMGEDNRFVAETMQMRQEEQDLVNMMASSRFHSFNGHVQMPVNLSSAHSPLPVPPSILGSLGYAHRNSAGLVPTSIPSFDSPWSSNIHHSQGLISLPVSQYFPSIGMASNREEMVEPVDDHLVSAELNQEYGKHGFWSDRDTLSVRGYDRYNQSYEGQLEERQQFASASNFGHSSWGSSSDSYSPKDHGLNKENRGCIRENYGDNSQHQTTKESDAYSTASSRFIPSSQARIIPSTEKVWESKLARDRRGRKEAPSTDSSDVYVLGKNRWQFDYESVDHTSSQADDDDREWIPLSTATTDTTECIGLGAAASSLVRTHHPHGYEHSEVSGSNSMLPVAPVLVGSGSLERAMDNNGVLPFAFYPTGPPVPFLTMLPVYNFPNEMETSSASTNHFEGDEELNNCCVNHSDLSLDSTENLDQSEIFDKSNIMKSAAAVESSENHKPDILNSDFMSHWHNLLYGRFCQNARHNGPLLNPSSAVVVPPMYLHGNFPMDVPGRPPANMNPFTQLMSYSPRLIPVMPLQPDSNRAAGVYQHYADEIPRYRGGTGTYLPNPKISFRDRHSSNTRNHRGNYSYDRKDRHGDREGTWNINSKSRYAGRGQGRNQVEKSSLRMDRTTANNSQSDKTWDSLKDDALPSYGSFSSSNAMTHDSAKAAYGMYPSPVLNPSGVNSSGASLPSVVMLYPYDQNMDYGTPAEQLEFGSLGPVHYTGINEVSHLGGGTSRSVKEQQNYPGDSVHSSPDQPSSPNLQR